MPILVLLFIAVPIAELYVIIKVGSLIGILPTLAILIADALLGSMLLRQQGRAAWRRFNAALEERRFPAKEAADGVMIAVGGTLLLTPGFITDVFGLLLLLPPSRALIRNVMWRFLRRRFRVVEGPAGWGYGRMRGEGPEGWPSGGRPYDVEGSGREVPPNGEPPEPRREDRELPPRPPS